MRGLDVLQERMFTLRPLNGLAPGKHPLRPILIDARPKHASGAAEREAALDMLGKRPCTPPKALGVDKAYVLRDPSLRQQE
jgi:hypothetical protein